MAEFIAKDIVDKKGLNDEFEINSKALSSEEIGNDIYHAAKRVLAKNGIAYSKRMASKFKKEDYDYYDEIYLMDQSNLRLIANIVVDTDNKIKLLNGIIDDPWYTGDFDLAFKQIKEGILNIL